MKAAFRYRPDRWTPDISRDGMLLIGLVSSVLILLGRFPTPPDAVAYWEAGTSANLYPQSWSEMAHGYLFYPPPVAQLSTLLQPIGLQLFVVLLTIGTFGAFWYCARAWSLPLFLIGVPSLFDIGPTVLNTLIAYIYEGNLQWILAALVIVALKHPAVWALQLVAKVTPAIGWWWHVLRGEWRHAAIGAAASIAIVSVSVVLAPNLWIEYLGFAARNYAAINPPFPTFPIPLGIRLLTGIPVLVWGARTDRPWTVPVVCGWSLVAVFGSGFLPFWVAGARLWFDQTSFRTRSAILLS